MKLTWRLKCWMRKENEPRRAPRQSRSKGGNRMIKIRVTKEIIAYATEARPAHLLALTYHFPLADMFVVQKHSIIVIYQRVNCGVEYHCPAAHDTLIGGGLRTKPFSFALGD